MKRKNNVDCADRLKIGGNIRKWRNIKEVKQKELAASLHLSEAAISNIENDITDVTLSQLENISITLDVPVEQLFTDPQETLRSGTVYASGETVEKNQMVMDKEVLYAILDSMQKKDQQMQHVLQNLLLTMKKVFGTDILYESLPKA